MRHIASIHRLALLLALCSVVASPTARAAESSSLDQVLDAIVAREDGLLDRLQRYQPLVETYLQSVRTDGAHGAVPVKDRYFLGRLRLAEPTTSAKGGKHKTRRKSNEKLVDLYHYSVSSNPDGFARMLTLDSASFDLEHYRFEFVRREFLGEIRTLVFDVMPKTLKGAKPGRFTGRIWVEDLEYNIVRFNGLYDSLFRTNLHFDSWRVNVAPGLWLPAYVYTEEPDRPGGNTKLKHKGQTRIWGYNIERRNPEEEFTKVMVETALAHDASESPGQISPVESFRAWEREAEENVLQRLEGAGLLAPEGEVARVLETVVANLELTNELDIYPPVRCRVLMTTPLESFTVGHTIVLSRGLIDVLPSEASLAMVLAHELGHVLSGHRLDTRYAFSDQLLVGDKEALEQFRFERDPDEELVADRKAIELLQNSPYKEDLSSAGLFLRALAMNSEALETLIRPHFGNGLSMKARMIQMAGLLDASLKVDPEALEQVAALPLGGRVKVDPWTARVELMKNNRVALMSAREKLPFQITPLMPHLARYQTVAMPAVESGSEAIALEAPAPDPTVDGEAIAVDRRGDESR